MRMTDLWSTQPSIGRSHEGRKWVDSAASERRYAAGHQKIFRCETDFAVAIIRTQLFDPAEIENVKKIQAEYRALPLSRFLNKPSPPTASEGPHGVVRNAVASS
jgi:hypothetical protein